ncbi:MAG: tetratricopeptide repeat protein [Acidobacteriota bacterium]
MSAAMSGAEETPQDPNAADARVLAQARYLFALGKVLAEEGNVGQAAEAFEQAGRLTPLDPYLLIERAQFAFRLAARARSEERRAEGLAEAVKLAEAAAVLAPENLDVLRSVAQIHLTLAGDRPDSLGKAISALESIRRKTPGDLRTVIPLAQVYLQQRQPDEAADVLSEAALQSPPTTVLYSLLVESLEQAGRTAEAADALRQLLGLDPTLVDERVKLATILGDQGDSEAALQWLEGAPEEGRANLPLLAQLAWQRLRLERFEGALESADAGLALEPDDPWLRFLRSQALAGLGRNDDAIAELDLLRELEPDNLELIRTAAELLEREGRANEGIRLLKESVARAEAGGEDRAIFRARFLLAGMLARANRVGEIEEVFAPALASDDREVQRSGYLILSDLLVAHGQMERALQILAQGAQAQPALQAKALDVMLRGDRDDLARKLIKRVRRSGDREVMVIAAQAAQANERYEWSLTLLDEVLEAEANHIGALFAAGAAHERLGDRPRAEASFHRLLELEPDHAHALNYLGYMWAEGGVHLEKALVMIQKAVDLDPTNGAFIDSLGWAHFRLGQFDEAREHLERAALLVPDDGTVAVHLADVYRALGETERARDLYQRALDLDPSTADEVRRKLETLVVD